MIEKISAVTLRVANMEDSVRFYKDVLGLEIVYGGESSHFKLRALPLISHSGCIRGVVEGMSCNFVDEPKVGVDNREFSSSPRTDQE